MNHSQKIKHLYSRAGFGLSLKEWEEKRNWSIQEATQALFGAAQNANIFIHKKDLNNSPKRQSQFLRKQEKERVLFLGLDWIERMASPSHSALLERMTLFWHGHFACTSKSSQLAIQQLHTIRQHALGSFRDLLIAIAKDPSMLRFLNNKQNRKNSPNENFARELLELFTIGRGNYTEMDVKEAARAFTGWSSNDQMEFVFKQNQHDYGQKTFMETTGDFDGEDIIHIILEKKETAVFICRKVYRYFVNDQVDEQRVEALANLFYESDYDIGQLMQHVFESDWFYDTQNIGAKIKSPIDLMAGIMRSFNVQFDNRLGLAFIQKALGQQLFNPPNVAGWAGGKYWIDNSTLMMRLNLVAYLFQQADFNFKLKDDLDNQGKKQGFRKLNATVNLHNLVSQLKPLEKSAIIDELLTLFIPIESSNKNAFIQKHSPTENKVDFIKLATMQIMSLPEYQMA